MYLNEKHFISALYVTAFIKGKNEVKGMGFIFIFIFYLLVFSYEAFVSLNSGWRATCGTRTTV
jgi:hypothetical protein